MQPPGLPPAIRPLIAAGPNAGRPRPLADICIDRLRLALQAACILKHSGFSVLDVELMEHHQPVVKVEADKRTAELVEMRRASYIAQGITQAGSRRVGQFGIDGLPGVLVQFEEWGVS